MLVGVDEAGRGPVLGAMFVAAVGCPQSVSLPDEIRDSKQLTPTHRERLASTIRDDPAMTCAVIEVPPTAIDEPTHNLNELTVNATRDALTEIASDDTSELTCILDACDVDSDRYARRVSSSLPARFAISAKHKADETEPIVAAASIIAKSAREAHVAVLSDEYGMIGSGYPGDPTTQTFLEEYLGEHGSLPACARESWRTCETLLARVEQSTLDVTK